MKLHFKDRGYSNSILNQAVNITTNMAREDLQRSNNDNKYKRSHSKSSEVPVFSTPHSAEFGKIEHIVRQYLPVLHKDSVCAQKGSRAPTIDGTLSPSLFTSKQCLSHWLQFKGYFQCGWMSMLHSYQEGGCHPFHCYK